MSRQLKDRPGEAAALNNLAVVLLKQGDYAEARRLYEESLKIAQELGGKDVVAASFNQLGILAQETGDYTEAHRLYEESLKIAQELENKNSGRKIHPYDLTDLPETGFFCAFLWNFWGGVGVNFAVTE